MAGRARSVRGRLRACESELRRLRGEVAAIRDWLDEVERKLAVLEVRLYSVRLDAGDPGDGGG